MGHKISPIAARLGINKTWRSVWVAKKGEFAKHIMSDIYLRKALKEALNPAGLDSMKIFRYPGKMEIEVSVARPGVAIGRGGEGIETLEKKLKKIVKMNVKVNIKEVKKPDLSARVIARTIADGMERRQPSKLLIAAAKDKAILAGAQGIKILIGGRINNASQARHQKDSAGAVPAQTFRANIDYAEETAVTSDAGLFGVKVWVYTKKNNKLEEEN